MIHTSSPERFSTACCRMKKNCVTLSMFICSRWRFLVYIFKLSLGFKIKESIYRICCPFNFEQALSILGKSQNMLEKFSQHFELPKKRSGFAIHVRWVYSMFLRRFILRNIVKNNYSMPNDVI